MWKKFTHLPFSYGVKHNWKKQSIFWRLSYWKTHLLCHNINVIHIERNVFMNVFDTVMNINELELKDIGRVKLFKPKAAYALTKYQRVAICKWVKELKLPDGYASNLGKLHGIKSHNCHVFIQWLLPIAFNLLPKHIWNPFVELSHFFRELTSTTLNVEKLTIMEGNIPMLLCKLEQIFPPSFFDSMGASSNSSIV
ncbi:hypothetical protein CR513_18337, partial [Mucuna pruriens]